MKGRISSSKFVLLWYFLQLPGNRGDFILSLIYTVITGSSVLTCRCHTHQQILLAPFSSAGKLQAASCPEARLLLGPLSWLVTVTLKNLCHQIRMCCDGCPHVCLTLWSVGERASSRTGCSLALCLDPGPHLLATGLPRPDPQYFHKEIS